MKIAVCADIHAHNYGKYSSVSSDGLNSRLNWILLAIGEIIKKSKEHKVDALVIAGDVFHSRKSIDVTVLDAVYNEFLKEKELPMYLVAGNHDIAESGKRRYSIKVFSKLMKVVTVPKVVEIAGNKVGMIPWTNDPDKLSLVVTEFKKQHVKYVIGHLGIKGGVTGNHDYVMEGDIEPSIFSKFTWVALGDYHKHQVIKSNIYYVGSPIQHSWGESDDKKGFMIFDANGGEFIELEGFPRFITVRNEKDAKTVTDKDYVKVVGKSQDIKSIIIPKGAMKVEIVERNAEQKSRIQFSDETYKGILQKYAQVFPQDRVDEDFLVSVGLSYIQKGE